MPVFNRQGSVARAIESVLAQEFSDFELIVVDDASTDGTAQVIEMMMHKDPAERYQNASDLLTDLDLIARGEPPHFARKNLDLSGVTASITDTIPTAPVVIEPPKKDAGIFDSPLVMILLVIIGISVLANIILTVLLAR